MTDVPEKTEVIVYSAAWLFKEPLEILTSPSNFNNPRVFVPTSSINVEGDEAKSILPFSEPTSYNRIFIYDRNHNLDCEFTPATTPFFRPDSINACLDKLKYLGVYPLDVVKALRTRRGEEPQDIRARISWAGEDPGYFGVLQQAVNYLGSPASVVVLRYYPRDIVAFCHKGWDFANKRTSILEKEKWLRAYPADLSFLKEEIKKAALVA